MKPQDKKNIISAIQHNLKEMQHQAQRYLDKHHTNLPPICSARHYLFHSLNLNTNGRQIDLKTIEKRISRDKGDKDGGEKGKAEQKKQDEKSMKFNPKTSIYNLQFTKKTKNDSDTSKKMPNLNLTLMRSRMNGSWRAGRYLDNLSSRTSLESASNNQKLKTIVLNSEALEQVDKDLKVLPNMFSPKLSKLNLPKKQSDVLQKYLTRFKQDYNSTQLERTQSTKLDELAEISTKELQRIIPKEPETEHCNKRSRVKICRQVAQTSQLSETTPKKLSRNTIRKSIRTLDLRLKSRLEQQLLKLPKHRSLLKNQKKQKNIHIDPIQIDCTPWGHEDKLEESISYDFS